MGVVLRKLGLFVVSTAVVGGATVGLAPAASAAEVAAAPVAATVNRPGPGCRPAHWGRDWQWHDGRRGHWDHREWDRRSHRMEWKHYWRDDRYCDRRGPDRDHDWDHDRGPGGPRH